MGKDRDYPPNLWLIYDDRAWSGDDGGDAVVFEVCRTTAEAHMNRDSRWPGGRVERVKRTSAMPSPRYDHEAWEDW